MSCQDLSSSCYCGRDSSCEGSKASVTSFWETEWAPRPAVTSQLGPSFLSAEQCQASSETLGFGEVAGGVSLLTLPWETPTCFPFQPSTFPRYLQSWEEEDNRRCCVLSSSVWTSPSASSSQTLLSYHGSLLLLSLQDAMYCLWCLATKTTRPRPFLFPPIWPLCTINLLAWIGFGLISWVIAWHCSVLAFKTYSTKIYVWLVDKYMYD